MKFGTDLLLCGIHLSVQFYIPISEWAAPDQSVDIEENGDRKTCFRLYNRGRPMPFCIVIVWVYSTFIRSFTELFYTFFKFLSFLIYIVCQHTDAIFIWKFRSYVCPVVYLSHSGNVSTWLQCTCLGYCSCLIHGQLIKIVFSIGCPYRIQLGTCGTGFPAGSVRILSPYMDCRLVSLLL